MSTSVTTGEVRFSFVHVFKPYAHTEGQAEKFSLTVLLPKSDIVTKQAIDSAIDEAILTGLDGAWGGVRPPKVFTPIHDGDGVKQDGSPYGDECKGHWVFTANANIDYPPEVVDASGQAVLSATDVYSGCYGRVHIRFFPYLHSGKKGIGCGLGPVQKLRDGEPLGGSAPKASDVFSVLSDKSDTSAYGF